MDYNTQKHQFGGIKIAGGEKLLNKIEKNYKVLMRTLLNFLVEGIIQYKKKSDQPFWGSIV